MLFGSRLQSILGNSEIFPNFFNQDEPTTESLCRYSGGAGAGKWIEYGVSRLRKRLDYFHHHRNRLLSGMRCVAFPSPMKNIFGRFLWWIRTTLSKEICTVMAGSCESNSGGISLDPDQEGNRPESSTLLGVEKRLPPWTNRKNQTQKAEVKRKVSRIAGFNQGS